MLQLVKICKSYTTTGFVQTALNNVSVSFRDNEFAAILGPSGSGKTTLLNIIGGLDHYDSGNLCIDGVSTAEYKDRDWDAYRNNRIGFVFQSYNLIPHQSVLANVELALTLSGVSHTERRTRALQALSQVGLEDHAHKKPHQLSGGQMQRVAIARALVNDPEILLADEPTGALDSKTSIQIMDLLAKIANDRLVIMVTHNPELAQTYANRIITLADGIVRSDTNPFSPTSKDKLLPKKPTRKTGMTSLTALMLSFNNLMTKKGRTLMTAFAGSIGIIGIAAILALANGVNDYIKSVEEETLSEYPLSIQNSGFDITSMMVDSMNTTSGEDNATKQETKDADKTASVITTLTTMFSNISANDLAALKNYLDNNGGDINRYTQAIEYSYNITPLIYNTGADKPHQVNPDTSFSALGLGSTVSSNSFMSMSMSTNTFYEMPHNPNLYKNQYTIKAGRWPQNYNEMVLVLTGNGGISDFMLYTLGLRNTAELDEMIAQFASEEEIDVPDITEQPSYDEIMDVSFKLVNATDFYAYDDELKIWKDKSNNSSYVSNLIANGEDLHIVGIVQPREDATAAMLKTGINYPASLTTHVIDQAAQSTLVKEQQENPTINVFTGKPFGDEQTDNGFTMESLFTMDKNALQAAFSIDESKLSVDMSHALALPNTLLDTPEISVPSADNIVSNFDIDMPVEQIATLITNLMQNYVDYVQKFYETNPAVIPNPHYDKNDPTSSPTITNPAYNPNTKPLSAQEWLKQPNIQAQITETIQNIVGQEALEAQLTDTLQNYLQTTVSAYTNTLMQELQRQTVAALQQAINQITHDMANALSVNPEKFKDAFKINMSEDELSELVTSLMSTKKETCENNLKQLGYADFDKPDSIDIYPLNFKSKEHIVDILNTYNDRMTADGQDDKVITYTDFVGALMSSVTDIVNMISYVLVAFVAISLIVSSIMIGVITYISVLERKKEIGILRSIGASKADIGHVFNAETIIVGFAAGAIGIGITALACIPVNALVYSLFGVPHVALLPWQAALVLVAISVLLTFLAGLIPSSAASRKDPVEALRGE